MKDKIADWLVSAMFYCVMAVIVIALLGSVILGIMAELGFRWGGSCT